METMNWYAFGVAAGVLLAAAIILIRALFGKSTDTDFDERQVTARSKAYKTALFTLEFYLAADAGLTLLWRPWAEPGVDVLLGILFAMMVFVCVAIHYDAYRTLREKPWTNYLLFVILIIPQLLNFSHYREEGFVTDGRLNGNSLNPAVIAGLLIFVTVLAVHDIHRRREEVAE